MVKLVPVNLSERAYVKIKKMISEYRYSPGSRLNVEQLARDLGTSRTPIWEAIRRLEQEGLVKNVPNRGVFLVELTRAAAIELYSVREVLEGMAARLAVQRITDKALDNMERLLQEQERIVAEEDLVAYSKSDFEFHANIYAACGNAVLREMLESIRERLRPIDMRVTPILTGLYNDHQVIVRAMRMRDALLAESAFREHNQRILKELHSEDLDDRIRHAGIRRKAGGHDLRGVPRLHGPLDGDRLTVHRKPSSPARVKIMNSAAYSSTERESAMQERKGVITFKGYPMTLLGPEIKAGDKAPDFQVVDTGMAPVTLADFKGKVKIISAVPSLDTPTCDTETRRFNQEAAKLPGNVVVLTVSLDLPFAQKRWVRRRPASTR